MRTTILAAAAIAASLFTPALAEELNSGELMYVHLYDTNKDDLIDAAELINAFEKTDPFTKYDTNHNGKLTPAEYAAMANPSAPMGSADTDHDGTLTQQEYHAGVEHVSNYWFTQCDKDRNNTLSHAEMKCVLE